MTPEPQTDSAVSTTYAKSTRVGIAVFALLLTVVLCVLFYRGVHNRRKVAEDLQDDVAHAAEAPLAVDVVHVKPGETKASLTLPGEARAFYETTLFAQTTGEVSDWKVDIGDKVGKDKLLATIENPALDAELVAANAKVAQLKSEVHVAETVLKLAQVSYDRWNRLTPSGAVSVQDRDQKEAELQSSRAKLAAAQSQVALGDAEVKRLTKLENFKEVHAPFDGVITQRHIDFGTLVTAGSTSNNTPLFTIAKEDRIRVFVPVPQVAVPLLGKDTKVTVRSPLEYGDRVFPGTLDRNSSSIDLMTRTLRAEVIVENPDRALLPGMYVEATFESVRDNPPPEVPAGAICFRPEGIQVALVTADGKVDMRDITISRDLGDFVEIDAKGIDKNSVVALNVGNDVATGERVEPHNVDPPEKPAPATQPAATTRAMR